MTTTSAMTKSMLSSLMSPTASCLCRPISQGRPVRHVLKSPDRVVRLMRQISFQNRKAPCVSANRFALRFRGLVICSLGEQPEPDSSPKPSTPSVSAPLPDVAPLTSQDLESREGNGRNQTIALLSVISAVGLFAATKFGNAGVDLSALASSSLPYDLALSNGRPTVVEFYADWCEVCRQLAPEVYAVEQDYRDTVNFVMMNIDNAKWTQELAEFGVEGIPHFVFLDADGNEEGNVVGKLPRKVLEANLAALARGDATVPYSRVMGQYSVKGERGAQSTVEPRSHSS